MQVLKNKCLTALRSSNMFVFNGLRWGALGNHDALGALLLPPSWLPLGFLAR